MSETEESLSDNPPNDRVFSFKRIYDEAFRKHDSNGKFESEWMESSDPLFNSGHFRNDWKTKGDNSDTRRIFYFSAHQSSYLIDLKSTDTILWYADIGWITGQTWIVYGSPIIGSTARHF